MRFSSFFDQPFKKIEKDFFGDFQKLSKPELKDTKEYSEKIESKVSNEEIFHNSDSEIILKINCLEFKPEEITITVENNQLLIEGIQEKIIGNEIIKRNFTRKIILPENSITKDMSCSAKPNSFLTIKIPKKIFENLNKNEKIIPIKIDKSK